MPASDIRVIEPALAQLPEYVAALQTGWSPDNVRLAAAAAEELQKIDEDPGRFVASLTDLEAKGGSITLPDGSQIQRLPGLRRWLWDGEFCGSIGCRWQPGTPELPPHVLGHVGYSVVPWKRKRGYATYGLKWSLDYMRQQGLPYVVVTTEPDNLASQKVILANGGILIERFTKPAAYGLNNESLRYHINL